MAVSGIMVFSNGAKSKDSGRASWLLIVKKLNLIMHK
jgi:hypothetical protein